MPLTRKKKYTAKSQRSLRKQQAVLFYHREHREQGGNIKIFELSNTESAGIKENYRFNEIKCLT
ncbi:hypothetical protein DCC35_16655 [Mangrovivirga cuniculi]|uniref:Uncharacterized protein n=1 Tax=Mangrovivirga cuniculi TaxID=2715131 RepID=A0A4D7JZW9_9BACT|nr:hypothetical protein DCC35_16655 [Mangrovivirga cuniculi]